MSVFVLLTVTGLGLAGLYFLLASGLSLIFGLMDVLNLAHGAFFTIGGYAAWAALSQLDIVPNPTLRFAVAVLIAAGVGFLVGAVVEAGLVRRLYGDHVGQILLTIGLGLSLVALLGGWFSYDVQLLPQPEWFRSTVEVAGARLPLSRLLIVAVSLVLLAGLLAFLRFTRHGLIIRAGVENRAMVEALGIDVSRSFTIVFGVGGLLAAVGGALGGVFFNGINPELGTANLIFAFIVVVIGGLGSVTGTALAALLVGLTQQYVNFYGATGLGDLAVVALLAAVLLIRPQGLLGKELR